MKTQNSKIEKRLWDAADQLRANSKLTSTEYSMPVLGLIFLRHAYNRYLVVEEDVKKNLPKRNGITRKIKKDDFTEKSALYLRPESQYEYLLNLPGRAKIGDAIIHSMQLIEDDYPKSLKGVLPKDYNIFENDVLIRLIKYFNDDALKDASGDVFGRIYEYFLMKFAMSGAQDSGEFFTPVSLVQTIVNVIEPGEGIVFDPACGSGGMFVQTAHFLENFGKNISRSVTFYGQEKTATTIKLAKMNLAVHGLEGKIAEGNTFYQDEHEMFRKKADFVMANPPFNVDGVDAGKIKADPRLPFGLPGVNDKGDVSNGNYLWISYFYSYLNDKGRAGFVMSSQASSAGNKEKEVRRKLIETGHVDVIISIRSNFFYTRSVPCELWFLNKGKPKNMLDKVLMIDARNIYRKYEDSRRIFEFSPEQLKNITSIVWLYRGETKKYLDLVKEYFESVIEEASQIEREALLFNEGIDKLSKHLESFLKTLKDLLKDKKSDIEIDKEKAKQYETMLTEYNYAVLSYLADYEKLCKLIPVFFKKYGSAIPIDNKQQIKAASEFDPISIEIKTCIKHVESVYKFLIKALDYAEKELTAKDYEFWNSKEVNSCKKELQSSKEIPGLKENAVEQFKATNYYYKQIVWLQTKFTDAKLVDVEGLVKLVNQKDVEESDWSLAPGRYVGVTLQAEDDDFDFDETIKKIIIELIELNNDGIKLGEKINQNFSKLIR